MHKTNHVSARTSGAAGIEPATFPLAVVTDNLRPAVAELLSATGQVAAIGVMNPDSKNPDSNALPLSYAPKAAKVGVEPTTTRLTVGRSAN